MQRPSSCPLCTLTAQKLNRRLFSAGMLVAVRGAVRSNKNTFFVASGLLKQTGGVQLKGITRLYS